MVTRRGPGLATVPASPQHSRSRNSLGAAAAIRRGEIGISNPIPPRGRYEEEGGAGAGAGAGAGQGQGRISAPASDTPSPAITAAAQDDIRPPQPPQSSGLHDGRPLARGRRAAHANDLDGDPRNQQSKGDKSAEVLPSQPSSLLRRSQQQKPRRSSLWAGATRNKRTSKMNRVSYETDGDNAHDNNDDDAAAAAAKEKRESGSFRSVLRRVFGGSRSRKDEAPTTRRTPTISHDAQDKAYWPDNERKAPAQDGTIITSDALARPHDPIMSMPVHEITPKTPLGSHLPFPMNVNAPQESPTRQGTYGALLEDPELPTKGLRRRTTLPSLHLSPGDLAALSSMWGQDGRDSVADVVRRRTPTPDIGMAITSPSARCLNRRSKSAGTLAKLAREHARTEREIGAQKPVTSRAAEIAYWRASYGPSGVEARDFDSSTETQLHQERSVKSLDMTITGTSRPTPRSGAVTDDKDVLHYRTPADEPQSSERPSRDTSRTSRGQQARERSATSDDAFAAPPGHARNFSRPGPGDGASPDHDGVEARLIGLERMVRSLQKANHRSTVILDRAPKGRRAASDSSSQSSGRVYEQRSGEAALHTSVQPPARDSPSQIQGFGPRTPKLPPGTASFSWSQAHAASPANISRGFLPASEPGTPQIPTQDPPTAPQDKSNTVQTQNPSAVPSSVPSPNVYDHLAPLYAALRYERSKRKEFEVQMSQIRQQLSELTQTVRAQHGARKPTGYHRGQRHGPAGYPTPSPEDTLGDSISSDEHTAMTHPQQSRFSGVDYSSESDYGDGERGAGGEELFGAPRESSMPPLPVSEPGASQQPPPPSLKQSTKDLRPGTAGREVRHQPSQAGLGNGSKNRFGFPGGKS